MSGNAPLINTLTEVEKLPLKAEISELKVKLSSKLLERNQHNLNIFCHLRSDNCKIE